MTEYLDSAHFPATSPSHAAALDRDLASILSDDLQEDMFSMLAGYQRILADNGRRDRWPAIHQKLETLFKCGRNTLVDGPMIGIPVSIRDSDYFKETARRFGVDRSAVAGLELMATAWNMTFCDTGLWMGKTFEPVTRETVAEKTDADEEMLAVYDADATRIGRNFFRESPDPDLIQGLGLPVLTRLWGLRPRPASAGEPIFDTRLSEENRVREQNIPYSMTGGIFLAAPGDSVVPEMNGKPVYQLNYRWPRLEPAYPMTRLIDELVQVAEGIYLGQLVFATRHYSLGNLELPFLPGVPLGKPYAPSDSDPVRNLLSGKGERNYGYQNNGYFLMLDPAHADRIYADDVFPQLRPRPGESGYRETSPVPPKPIPTKKPRRSKGRPARWPDITDWAEGWKNHPDVKRKFTTFIREESPVESDTEDVREMRRDDESILQMLHRVSREISARTAKEDHLRHFENLNRLFRQGVAPRVVNGLFQGHGEPGYNCRVDGREKQDWYGEADVARGFDYYHGATLNLHLGFRETLFQKDEQPDEGLLFPGPLGLFLAEDPIELPNILNLVWQGIGRYIFPWAGKSFERISGRKLSMLLDESPDLTERYPRRVGELQSRPASLPHYDLVEKAKKGYWDRPGPYAEHLKSGPYHHGMSEEDMTFWDREAAANWVDGNNIQDERILAADPLFRIIDMNYRTPDPYLQSISETGPSPFVRQGYCFLGTGDRTSILPMNNGKDRTKTVFQFHYRYPLIGGPAPIGYCLDELVEIADGLFLGQLIYATALNEPFHSSVDPARYRYQLFGYFLLLDDAWEHHRQAIGLDVWRKRPFQP